MQTDERRTVTRFTRRWYRATPVIHPRIPPAVYRREPVNRTTTMARSRYVKVDVALMRKRGCHLTLCPVTPSRSFPCSRSPDATPGTLSGPSSSPAAPGRRETPNAPPSACRSSPHVDTDATPTRPDNAGPPYGKGRNGVQTPKPTNLLANALDEALPPARDRPSQIPPTPDGPGPRPCPGCPGCPAETRSCPLLRRGG